MKYINKFREDIEEISIKSWCIKLGIENYTINDNEIVDVNNDVTIYEPYLRLEKIPIQFGIVNGYFNCSTNELITLEGSPSVVNSLKLQ